MSNVDQSASKQGVEETGPAVIQSLVNNRLTLTMNRAHQKNVLSAEIIGGLRAGLAEAEQHDDVRMVVITNTGSTFCAGADLKSAKPAIVDSAKDGGPDPTLPDNPFVALLQAIRHCPKPVLARMDGHATGGGVGVAAVCDLSVVRDDALIGFTEVRVGVAPAIISVVCLPKMRPGDAAELMLGGERITGRRAADLGLINYAEPGDSLDNRVDMLCNAVLKGGPSAVAATKALMQTVPQMSVDEAFADMALLSAHLFTSEEAAEGMAAFKERRTPRWRPTEA